MTDIDAVVLGASGYVGGELLRLIHAHPHFRLAAAVSESHDGETIGSVFPHLAAAYEGQRFVARDGWADGLARGTNVALFSAAPHGSSAALIADALVAAAKHDLNVHAVDSSADFRYDDPAAYRRVYGTEHGAPELLPNFFCAVPEHARAVSSEESSEGLPDVRHIGHPGCFATAVLLAAMPLVAGGLVENELYVCGTTGSTGAGRAAQNGTHHPERHSNLYAYKALAHRHVPEVERLIGAASRQNVTVNFVPHSGPFARGIYITLQAKLTSRMTEEELRDVFQRYYDGCEFVRLVNGAPRLKDVVASNYSHLGCTTANDTAVVMCAIDNLVKGAAGGAVQWMNRLWSLPETSGLLAPAPAWT